MPISQRTVLALMSEAFLLAHLAEDLIQALMRLDADCQGELLDVGQVETLLETSSAVREARRRVLSLATSETE